MTENSKILHYIPEMKIKERSVTFMPKAFSRLVSIEDGVEPCFRSSLSVFIPKLTPKYAKRPNIMLHVSNGKGSCLIRFTNREVLMEKLQQIMDALQSDRFIDTWERINDISQDIALNDEVPPPFFDEECMDINAWNKALAHAVNVAKVRVKKEFDTSTQKKYK